MWCDKLTTTSCTTTLQQIEPVRVLAQEAFEKCWAHSPLRADLHCHSPGVATVARRHCRTPPAHRCPRQRRQRQQQRQRVTVSNVLGFASGPVKVCRRSFASLSRENVVTGAEVMRSDVAATVGEEVNERDYDVESPCVCVCVCVCVCLSVRLSVCA